MDNIRYSRYPDGVAGGVKLYYDGLLDGDGQVRYSCAVWGTVAELVMLTVKMQRSMSCHQ